jgi:hypothetical protein
LFDELLAELAGIRDALPSAWYDEVEESEGEDSQPRKGKIDSEEIEVAISGLVASLSKKLGLTDEPGSLSALLESLFSPEDDAVSIAINLEDAVNGYFGELFGENLELAHAYLSDLIELLEKRRASGKARKTKQSAS